MKGTEFPKNLKALSQTQVKSTLHCNDLKKGIKFTERHAERNGSCFYINVLSDPICVRTSNYYILIGSHSEVPHKGENPPPSFRATWGSSVGTTLILISLESARCVRSSTEKGYRSRQIRRFSHFDGTCF